MHGQVRIGKHRNRATPATTLHHLESRSVGRPSRLRHHLWNHAGDLASTSEIARQIFSTKMTENLCIF
jgi:hypothetical protein